MDCPWPMCTPPLVYYYDHRQAIDEAMLADESYTAELRSRTKSKLSETIGG